MILICNKKHGISFAYDSHWQLFEMLYLWSVLDLDAVQKKYLVRFYLNTANIFGDIIIELAQISSGIHFLFLSFLGFFACSWIFCFSLILFAYFWNHVYNQELKRFTIRAVQMANFPV